MEEIENTNHGWGSFVFWYIFSKFLKKGNKACIWV